jgi:spore maturation protein CgeB
MSRRMRLVFLGLSLSSSWGNGHATTYRGLLRALARRGHDILFLERERRWYAENCDLSDPPYCRLAIYDGVDALAGFRKEIADADAVIVGSYVPDGLAVAAFAQAAARGVTAFYDIDTPVTLAKLARRDFEYISPALIGGFDLYLSFSAGPALRLIEERYGARAAHALHCAVDPAAYRPVRGPKQYDLGYLGTYSDDRQPGLERLLLEPARRNSQLRFVVAGPLYPPTIAWPANVTRVDHVPPSAHAAFYGSCRFTLNVTRSDMIALGYSPSVRLFEAAAAETPIISDDWEGLDAVLEPGRELVVARNTEDVIAVLTGWPERRRRAMARNARRRILAEHTAEHRAEELEALLLDARAAPRPITASAKQDRSVAAAT